jgi:addiction module HigA family antidote
MKKQLAYIHPGEILSEDFLIPMNISAYRLAKETHLDTKRISEIIHGKRAISADTALRFSKFFGTSAGFWLNLQNHYDLELKTDEIAKELQSIQNIQTLQLV